MENHIHQFRITLKQQLILLTHTFFTNASLIFASLYFLKVSLTSVAFISVFTFFFLIDTLPTIILHVQYWLENRDAVLILDTELKELVYETYTKKLRYLFTDIASLQYYRNLGKGSGWHSFGQYRYYKIVFNDGKEIFITCLMINNIENTLETLLRIKAEKHSKLLCLLQRN
jgi:hypothetical protein